MPPTQSIKFPKGIEKVIVCGNSGKRDKAAHGEGINQRVVEVLVRESACSSNSASFTGYSLRRARRGRHGFHEGDFCKVHAEAVFRPRADKRLRIDSAAQVIVQISALRHGPQKHPQLERISTRCVEGLGSALLRTRASGRCLPSCRLRRSEHARRDEQGCAPKAREIRKLHEFGPLWRYEEIIPCIKETGHAPASLRRRGRPQGSSPQRAAERDACASCLPFRGTPAPCSSAAARSLRRHPT